MLSGVMPEGYGEVEPLANGVRVPGGMTLSAAKAWAGDLLRVDRYQIRNANTWSVALREQDFWRPGVRAVMFDSNAQTLLGGGTLMMTVIRASGEGNDGQR
uniref:hypothetical protein n=1 Tax=Serratia proteamaculans TaxID=28151 RepID=UPI003B676BED